MTYLNTPTPDESGQSCHPDVYDAGEGNTLHGYRYWMTHSPAFNGGFTQEFLCVLVSNDGLTWVEPAGFTNPISEDIRPDPDLTVDGDGKMWIVYALSSCNGVAVRSSTDGITWSDETVLLQDGVVLNHYTSPSVVFYDGLYHMFYVRFLDTPETTHNVIEMRTCPTIDGEWSEPITCSLTLLSGYPWHLNVIADGNILWMCLNVSQTTLVMAKSLDGGATWAVEPLVTLAPAGPGYWDWLIYSSCILRSADGFRLWYSANDNGTPKTCHIGYTTFNYGVDYS